MAKYNPLSSSTINSAFSGTRGCCEAPCDDENETLRLEPRLDAEESESLRLMGTRPVCTSSMCSKPDWHNLKKENYF